MTTHIDYRYRVYLDQRISDRQWCWRVTARNGKQVGWSGEFYRNRAHARRMATALFPHLPISERPARRG